MVFRKNSLLFYQLDVLCIFMATACLSLVPTIGLVYSLLYMLPFIVLIFAMPKLHNEYITINESGILCRQAGKLLWSYEWDSVAKLKKSSRFLMPSIEVITYNQNGKPECFALPNHYFQLGKTARKAIDRYYYKAERGKTGDGSLF